MQQHNKFMIDKGYSYEQQYPLAIRTLIVLLHAYYLFMQLGNIG